MDYKINSWITYYYYGNGGILRACAEIGCSENLKKYLEFWPNKALVCMKTWRMLFCLTFLGPF